MATGTVLTSPLYSPYVVLGSCPDSQDYETSQMVWSHLCDWNAAFLGLSIVLYQCVELSFALLLVQISQNAG